MWYEWIENEFLCFQEFFALHVSRFHSRILVRYSTCEKNECGADPSSISAQISAHFILVDYGDKNFDETGRDSGPLKLIQCYK